jgi:hypothetical protein
MFRRDDEPGFLASFTDPARAASRAPAVAVGLGVAALGLLFLAPVLGALAGIAAALLGGAVTGRAHPEDARARTLGRVATALGVTVVVLFVVLLIVAALL